MQTHYGRYEIFTDVPKITSENLISVLQKAMPLHMLNADRETFLLNYESGYQPIQQKKIVRKDIDIKDIDNIAHEITTFNLGFKWGNPITIAQRGEKDSGTQQEAEAIALLNEGYTAEGIETKTQKLARFIEITGIGYTYVDVKTNGWTDGDSYFQIEALDPRFTFVVKSSYYIDRRPMMGVTFRQDESGTRYFTCFTADRRFEVIDAVRITDGQPVKDENGNIIHDWTEDFRSGEKNPLGMVPIVEWIMSYDRMGCFEREISDCDALNILASDILNGITQDINTIWHSNDVDFPEVEETDSDGNTTKTTQKPKSNDWICTHTSPDGKTPFIKALTVQSNYSGMLSNYITKRQLILQKCFVPQRNDDSGGSTGVAMSDATGWSAAEQVASAQQLITESCKTQEVKVVLQAIKLNPNVPADSPLLTLRYMDVKPNIKRQKTYELTVKSNAFATLVSHGVNGLHALKIANMCEDVNQTWADSEDTIEKYQKSIFEPKEQTTNEAEGGDGEKAPDNQNTISDESDQVGNSSTLDKQ